MPDQSPRERLRPILYLLVACTLVSMVDLNGRSSCSTRSARRRTRRAWSVVLRRAHDWEVLVRGDAARARDAGRSTVTSRSRDAALRTRHHCALTAVGASHGGLVRRRVEHRCSSTSSRWRCHASARRWPPARAFAERASAPCSSRTVASGIVLVLLGGVALAWLIPRSRCRLTHSCTRRGLSPLCAAQWLEGAPEPLESFDQYGEGGSLREGCRHRGDRSTSSVTPRSWATRSAPVRQGRDGRAGVGLHHPQRGHRRRPLRRQHAACPRRDGARRGSSRSTRTSSASPLSRPISSRHCICPRSRRRTRRTASVAARETPAGGSNQ